MSFYCHFGHTTEPNQKQFTRTKKVQQVLYIHHKKDETKTFKGLEAKQEVKLCEKHANEWDEKKVTPEVVIGTKVVKEYDSRKSD